MKQLNRQKEKPWWIIVGGRIRLGKALAERLAVDYNLVLTSSVPWEGENAWIRELSRQTQVACLEWDARNPELVSRIQEDLSALAGSGIQPACCVLVAGSFPHSPLGTWDPAGLEDIWRLNLTFPCLVSQGVGPILMEGGCLQFLLDTAIHKTFINYLPYSLTKTALAALVESLARILSPRIRVVGHALGTVLPNANHADPDTDPQGLASCRLAPGPGTPEDVARALRFAAQSPFLTGEIITLDGGRRWVS